MMEWLSDNPGRGESVLALIAVAITGIAIWLGVAFLGRKKLVVTVLVAFTWLIAGCDSYSKFYPRTKPSLSKCLHQ